MTHETALTNALNDVVVSYNQGQHRYLNEFVRLYKSASDMLQLGLFPDAKEITESYAAFNAVSKKLKQYKFDDPEVTLVSVGDGRTPRTAALFAFRTKWQCVSVDPLLKVENIKYWEDNIQQLMCIPQYVEDIDLNYDKVVIVAVHSHANLQKTLEHVRGKTRSLVAIPCCKPYNHEIRPIEYRDAGIWSPKNLVKVWKMI